MIWYYDINIHVILTRAPLALQIFHHLLGGGGVVEHPLSISTPIGRREKRNKNVRKLVKNDYKTISVNFS